jgi:HAMP domain-containing protein
MATRTILLTGLRILVVCLLFAVCFTVGGVLSGLGKVAQQLIASQPDPRANQQAPRRPEIFFTAF